MKKQLYKVLDKDLVSPFQKFQYEVGKEYRCNNFNEDASMDCASGFYATDIKGLPYSFNACKKVFLCEVWGRSVEIDAFKRRYSRIRLLEEVPHAEIKRLAMEKEVEVGYKLAEALFPVNPLLVKRSDTVSADEIALLKKWHSVIYSVGHNVWRSVIHSVRHSIGHSVVYSVGLSVIHSVGLSVGHSVWAYIGTLFPNIKNWKYIDHKEGEYPFQSGADLWRAGLVPSYDGNTWRLHTGKDAEVVYEWYAQD